MLKNGVYWLCTIIGDLMKPAQKLNKYDDIDINTKAFSFIIVWVLGLVILCSLYFLGIDLIICIVIWLIFIITLGVIYEDKLDAYLRKVLKQLSSSKPK